MDQDTQYMMHDPWCNIHHPSLFMHEHSCYIHSYNTLWWMLHVTWRMMDIPLHYWYSAYHWCSMYITWCIIIHPSCHVIYDTPCILHHAWSSGIIICHRWGWINYVAISFHVSIILMMHDTWWIVHKPYVCFNKYHNVNDTWIQINNLLW